MRKFKRRKEKQMFRQLFVEKFRRNGTSSPELEMQSGQVLVMFVISFMAIVAFVGIVTDAGALYVTYTQLKRAVDAAAVAAANNLKNPGLTYSERKTRMTEAAREMLDMHNIANINLLEVYTCNDSTLPAEFSNDCLSFGPDPRKLAWVQATQESPVYFLSLFGIQDVPLTVRSIGEAATIDLVIVIDSSESMGSETAGYGPNFDPNLSCNPTNTCEPLLTAKNAAKVLVDNMFEGYDQIAIVSFDFDAKMEINLTNSPYSGVGSIKAAIDNIKVHDDTPVPLDPVTLNPVDSGTYNPLNVDVVNPGDLPNPHPNNAVLSTCTGCAIREAGKILLTHGRRDSVWVIVFLSDGSTNVSDIPPKVDSIYPNGFCGGAIGESLWINPMCRDANPATRHCGPYHSDISECAPGATWAVTSPPYDVEDYARDMIDRVALWDAPDNEPITANQVTIYSIGLGHAAVAPHYAGEEMLRYMANVGENGSRLNDPCDGVPHQKHCGNYYYSPDATHLAKIFEDIAGRIFSRISR